MQSKWIATALVGAGALFGWAITADQAALVAKKRDDEWGQFVDQRDAEWNELLQDKTDQIFALKNDVALLNGALGQDDIWKNVKAVYNEDGTINVAETFSVPKVKGPEDVWTAPTGKYSDAIQSNFAPAEHTISGSFEATADVKTENEDKPEVSFVNEAPKAPAPKKTSKEIIAEFRERLEAEGNPDLDEWDEELNETVEETRSNLQRLIDQYVPTDDDNEAFVAHAAVTTEVIDKTPPYVISQALFAYDEEFEHFDKITLTYYPSARILLDDDQELISDIPAHVGWKNLNRFGDQSEDKDTVFIRNKRLMTDFEVVRETEDDLPLHIRYGMDKETFAATKAAGLLKFRPEDL